jgi:Tol biopolymer transport system component
MLVFTRTGGSSISEKTYLVPVSETGRPESSPTQIELPLTTSDLLAGWTPDNEIGVLLANPEHLAIYTVSVSGGNATQVTPQGGTDHPRWSPDGERIYFRWFRDGYGSCIASVPSEGGVISIGPLDGDSRIFEILPGGGNVVSPDGKKMVFSGAIRYSGDSKRDDKVAIYIIPIEGDEPEKLTVSPGQDSFPCWSPDGRWIAFLRWDYYAPEKENNYIRNICIVPTGGGEVRQLTSESHRARRSAIAWSPDGELIAYFSLDNEIRVIPVQGGESRKVIEVEDVGSHSELDWSPDGSKLAYSSRGSIWVVPLDGGEPEEIKTGLDAKATHISWSPDGKEIAFSALKGGDVELWLMEDFLPAQSE